jgi:hypothetical protein
MKEYLQPVHNYGTRRFIIYVLSIHHEMGRIRGKKEMHTKYWQENLEILM